MGLTRLTIAADAMEAEIICALLRDCGIQASYRRTGPRAGRAGKLDIGGSGRYSSSRKTSAPPAKLTAPPTEPLGS